MTDAILLYYNGLKRDLEEISKKLLPIENAIDCIDVVKWDVTVWERGVPAGPSTKLEISKVVFLDMLLAQRKALYQRQKQLETMYASNELILKAAEDDNER